MSKRVAFCTLGCKVNQYETDGMTALFENAGYEIRAFEEEADIYIVNTCTVTNIADHKSRQMLRRPRKLSPDAVVAAVGCYAQEAGEKLVREGLADLVVGNDVKSRIVEIVEEYIKSRGEEQMFSVDIGTVRTFENIPVSPERKMSRAYIKIQDGCNQFCSYCIIPYARGRIRSRDKGSIVSEARLLAEAGYKEVILTGIHISSYGLDRASSEIPESSGGDRLIDVIEAVSKYSGISRIRLGSMEPRIITEEMLQRLAKIPQFCPHFHLSLQSGSDSVLKRMNRHYTTEEYAEKCSLIRNHFPHAGITTDVITGFPGETDKEFEETRKFVQRIHFSDMHIFKYSRREGTVAARMQGQVRNSVSTERSRILIELAQSMQQDFLRENAEIPLEMLPEEKVLINGEEYCTGYSRNYIKCAVPADSFTAEGPIKVKLTGRSEGENAFAVPWVE
ncbi:MAG: tRNA (N(6)-L-threonylcarbamoyladenosine(37)-C(2))-methylthiotransferase MtaB [Lachnospiraceae bacterium]|nr:tRNA (N(6)-L-threonylcarbamoyladenosine(37)-C(2))-methylthiotransferase MtaB [Lachnospiraceae bacterium]